MGPIMPDGIGAIVMAPRGIQSCRFNPASRHKWRCAAAGCGPGPGGLPVGPPPAGRPPPLAAWAPMASGHRRAQTLCGVRACSGLPPPAAAPFAFCAAPPPARPLPGAFLRLRRGARRARSRARPAGPPAASPLAPALVRASLCSGALFRAVARVGLRALLCRARAGPPPASCGAPLLAPGGCGGCRSGCPLGVAVGPPGRFCAPSGCGSASGGGFSPAPPRPAAPAGGSGVRVASSLGAPPRPAGSPVLSDLSSRTVLTFPNICVILFLRGSSRSFGGCSVRGIHGQRIKSGRKTGLFFCPFCGQLLRKNRRSDFSDVNSKNGPRWAFFRRVYNPEIVNLILYFHLRAALSGCPARPTQQNLCHFVAFVGLFERAIKQSPNQLNKIMVLLRSPF